MSKMVGVLAMLLSVNCAYFYSDYDRKPQEYRHLYEKIEHKLAENNVVLFKPVTYCYTPIVFRKDVDERTRYAIRQAVHYWNAALGKNILPEPLEMNSLKVDDLPIGIVSWEQKQGISYLGLTSPRVDLNSGCITASVTKHNIQVMEAGEIPHAIKSAFYLSSTGRKGAVLVDIPKDTQTNRAEMTFPDKIEFRGYHPSVEPSPQEI